MNEQATADNGNQNDVAAKKEQKEEQQSGALSLAREKGDRSFLSVKTIGNRPVEEGHLTVVGTFRSVGADRPIFAGDIEVADRFYSSGIRPVAAGKLQISESYQVMGNRPVASNQIDDPKSLMGFLD